MLASKNCTHVFFSILDVDHCLVSVVTWSRKSSREYVEKASILLSSLEEYISLRKLEKTPLTTLTLPQDLSDSDAESSDSSLDQESFTLDSPLLSKVKNFILDRQSSNNSSSSSNTPRKTELEKYSSILRYRWRNGKAKHGSGDSTTAISQHASNGVLTSDRTVASAGDYLDHTKTPLQRSVSDGTAFRQSLLLSQEMEDFNLGNEHPHDEEDLEENPFVNSQDPISEQGKIHYY